MKREFRLEKVLNYRGIILNKHVAKLADMTRQEQQLIGLIKSMSDNIRNKIKELCIENDFNMIELYNKYINKLEIERVAVQKVLIKHKQEVSKQKEITVAANKNKNILDKLKEEHRTAYIAYITKEEQKAMEDIVLTRKASQINRGEFDDNSFFH